VKKLFFLAATLALDVADEVVRRLRKDRPRQLVYEFILVETVDQLRDRVVEMQWRGWWLLGPAVCAPSGVLVATMASQKPLSSVSVTTRDHVVAWPEKREDKNK
jgi:hypothetical protein